MLNPNVGTFKGKQGKYFKTWCWARTFGKEVSQIRKLKQEVTSRIEWNLKSFCPAKDAIKGKHNLENERKLCQLPTRERTETRNVWITHKTEHWKYLTTHLVKGQVKQTGCSQNKEYFCCLCVYGFSADHTDSDSHKKDSFLGEANSPSPKSH